ncbi:hypothetical protein CEP54_002906 [Fusarium duplospermum]|uniref:Uncharacterized protein n=1 Tax=Fusarium duplospermum TaxID=1325734 RepID=A0A428QT08_9HYPO|nr:hypothetical protein CEP54_002906 [Fusarium duplospermum]
MASFGLHTTSDQASKALKENITGKTIVITGVSPGSLGADTAQAILAQSPAQLILASQKESKLHEVTKSLDIPAGSSVYPLVLDLASHDAVRKAAAELSRYVDAIGAMICTAGVMALPSYQESKDGWIDENGNLNSAIKVKTLAEGAATGIMAAFDHRLSNEGRYFLADGALTAQGLLPAAVDTAIAAKLWGISEKPVK